MTSIEKHKLEMKKLDAEIKNASGFRKKNLLRKYRRMSKELAEYQMWHKKAKAVI